MEISTGVTLPDATLLMKDADGIHSVSLADKMKGRKVIIFAVPGAFTPTCSSAHVPSFIRTKDAFAAKGVDEIICISVNDPHVMHAWGEVTGATGQGSQCWPMPKAPLPRRSAWILPRHPLVDRRAKRFAMYVVDGVVQVYAPEVGTGVCDLSGGEALLEQI